MEKDDIPCCEVDFWVFLAISLALVSLAGVTSGLALGLLSFSKVDLEVLIKSGQFHDQKNAAKILPLVRNEHLLLCTLLIVKSLAMEALPIFLDSVLPSWAAIIMSVTLVLAFAEIIPQAVCSRYGLSIGAKLSSFVRMLLVIFFPISKPLSKLLDWLLGEGHSVLFRRAELKTLVDLHANEAGKGGELSHHETMIIGGALDLTRKTAKDAMTPISEIFSLDINSKLDMQTMGLIVSKGHSRIPIYSGSRTNIIGLILVKNLIFCHPEDETPIKHMTLRRIPRVYDNWPLYDILKQFQKGHSHMAAVVKSKDTGLMNINTKLNLNLTPTAIQAHNTILCQKEHLTISAETSPSGSFDTEYYTPNSIFATEQEKGDRIISDGILESIQINSDEEVIGIITMEDVMEELLQGDILDETDQYVDVHNKIKINLRPLRRSSSRSPRRSMSHLHWRTPEQSPLSSYTPIIRSPSAPHTRPPFLRPTLYASPGKSSPNSPAHSGGSVYTSPSSYRVSRKSYEKLHQPTDS
ncbi:CBS domain containing protein [Parasponia andersonii]|uniref:CBS domain containing protein n=1 Tax=Parasponia andersonii TaxID=3476 RepID=A0A2P5CAY6_PARAD|nr:CBS domain containing protein [Parasponia andersonii]